MFTRAPIAPQATSGAGVALSLLRTLMQILTMRGILTTARHRGTGFVATGNALCSFMKSLLSLIAIIRSENILALQAPTTTKCDFCQVSFCGIGIPGRCVATPLASQHPHGLSDLSDLIQCGEIYDCFDHNPVEVDIMFDYLAVQNFTPRHIYREVSGRVLFLDILSICSALKIIGIIQRSPRQFQPLFDLDLFMDLHAVSGGTDPDPTAPRQRICRVCATEVLLWGLRDWWVQERKKGFLEEEIMKRPDCPEGSNCVRQKDHGS